MPTPSCSVLAFGLGCPVTVAAARLMSAVASVFCDSAVLGAAGMLSSTPTACSASGFSAVLLLPAAFGTGSRAAGCCVLSMVARVAAAPPVQQPHHGGHLSAKAMDKDTDATQRQDQHEPVSQTAQPPNQDANKHSPRARDKSQQVPVVQTQAQATQVAAQQEVKQNHPRTPPRRTRSGIPRSPPSPVIVCSSPSPSPVPESEEVLPSGANKDNEEKPDNLEAEHPPSQCVAQLSLSFWQELACVLVGLLRCLGQLGLSNGLKVFGFVCHCGFWRRLACILLRCNRFFVLCFILVCLRLHLSRLQLKVVLGPGAGAGLCCCCCCCCCISFGCRLHKSSCNNVFLLAQLCLPRDQQASYTPQPWLRYPAMTRMSQCCWGTCLSRQQCSLAGSG